MAYARDDTDQMVPGCGVKTTSDMAFLLPYDKSFYQFDGDKKKFGIGVSSLLWDEETGKHYNLKVNYKDFYKRLIEYLLMETEYQVHLIPHVVDKDNFNAPENDSRSCDELARMFPSKVIVAPAFDTALEAKSYISNMDMFMGSRMHSTIGAISSGVTTIPFSYAHKFESLYSKIGFDYVLSATKLTTEEAFSQIKLWINNPDPIKTSGERAVKIAMHNVALFQQDLKDKLQKLNLLNN